MAYNYIKAVHPLLFSLGYDGENRPIFESTPHRQDVLTLEELRELMANMGYLSNEKRVALKDLPDHPGLLHIEHRGVFVVLKADAVNIYLQNLERGKEVILPRTEKLQGDFCYFYTEDKRIKKEKTWLHGVAHRFHHMHAQLLVIGILNAIFGLTTPMFIRGVFDWAIASNSKETLLYLALGLGIALMSHHVVHIYQNRILAYIGARIHMIIGTSVLAKILKIPYHLVENASVSDQVTRIKQFDGLKEFFTSPLAQFFMEAPFFLFFIVILAFMGGPLVFVPIVLFILFAILAAVTFPLVRAGTRVSSFTHNQKLSFLLEAFRKINTLKFLGGEKSFEKRFEEKAYNQSKALEHNEIVMAYATNTAQILIKIGGVVTIIWGAVRVMDGLMTVGSLMAIVLLIWRALAPFQTAFMFLSQFDMTLSSMKQINQLMTIAPENYAPTYLPKKQISGDIFCDSLMFRYPSSPIPALQGIGMDAKKGEIITIMGENGSGKSTLLKLLLGFYPPMSGNIYLDQVDIKHIPVNHLRQSIGFVPQNIQFFHGTIEQNLILAAPHATREEIMHACKEAMVWDDICAMPEGLETRLSDRSLSELNSGFQQKLGLARAYLRKCSILIFDEPGSNLDLKGDAWFKKTLEKWHGEKTMLIVTHRPSVLKLSDKVLLLGAGKMRFFGPSIKLIEYMEKEGKLI